ncbi:MAG TPA: FRG domain-containing protein [Pyrinomonadaceae bacterium]|nr:FRG domain-containing protein [Pyrinomonadaceae bacterium]
MSTWSIFLRDIKKTVASLYSIGCDTPFFRGHADSSWTLLPSVGRYEWIWEPNNPEDSAEEALYFDFLTRAGSLLPENSSSWSNAFIMQHYGLPTRLLDWTETFSVALYFAIKNANEEAICLDT